MRVAGITNDLLFRLMYGRSIVKSFRCNSINFIERLRQPRRYTFAVHYTHVIIPTCQDTMNRASLTTDPAKNTSRPPAGRRKNTSPARTPLPPRTAQWITVNSFRRVSRVINHTFRSASQRLSRPFLHASYPDNPRW